MATTQDIHAPTLGAQGEPCASCGASLAGDQRYCLECGARRVDARIPFRDILARQGAAGPPQAPVVRAYPKEHGGPSGVTFLVGLVALLLALGVGVLIGRSGDDTPTAATQPPAPQVISVGGAAAAPAATTSTPTTSTPSGTSSSSGSSSSGSDKSSRSKDSGSSGAKGSSKATNKDVKSLDNSSGSDYEKKSSKLPKQVGTGGKPPPKDNKPAGGGSDFEDIG
jgi:hypothetical protein